jgi:hypothetical protein
MNPIYLLIALQLLDAVTTIVALKGDAYESNPILKKIMVKIGVVPTLVLVKGGVIVFFLYYQASFPPVIIWLMCAGYVWVVYNNVKVIKE